MQGHKSSITTLPENLGFDHGSTSTDTAIDSQMPWNTMQASSLNHLPDYEGLNSEWNLGETSSSPTHTQVDHDERKREHIWSIHQCEPSDLLSLDNPDVDTNLNGTANGPDALPQDLNIGIGSSNEQIPSAGNSSNSYMEESEEDRANCSHDGRRISCKRKALHIGQSSGAGSSGCAQIAESSIGTPTQVENTTVINNGPEQANPRLRLGVGRPASTSPISLPSRGNGEGSRRNFRLRFNGSHQQQDRIPVNSIIPNAADDVRNVDSSSSSRHSSRLMLRNHMVDVNPAENEIPSVRRNHHSRWSGASSSRTSSSSMERDPMLYEESLSRSIPRSISEHPMFVPASEMGGSSQQPTNWSLPGGSNPVAGNVGSGSRASSASGLNSSAPAWSHRNCPPYPRRLSEIVRRSLAGVTESGGQSGNYAMRSGSSAEVTLHSGSPGQHMSNSRAALLERHLDGAFGIPYSFRGLAAAAEGRSSIMSEQIRHVLDLMRRGEGLRFEDVMILDHSVFFGMADMHDRHRDMRLDVDNMSYEELLALEERIGNVCTGLSEDIITSRLKQHKYVDRRAEDQAEIEPCSICREEYNDGEDLGSLECGHDFHEDCIKQWLMHKNLCPICKTTGLTT